MINLLALLVLLWLSFACLFYQQGRVEGGHEPFSIVVYTVFVLLGGITLAALTVRLWMWYSGRLSPMYAPLSAMVYVIGIVAILVALYQALRPKSA